MKKRHELFSKLKKRLYNTIYIYLERHEPQVQSGSSLTWTIGESQFVCLIICLKGVCSRMPIIGPADCQKKKKKKKRILITPAGHSIKYGLESCSGVLEWGSGVLALN